MDILPALLVSHVPLKRHSFLEERRIEYWPRPPIESLLKLPTLLPSNIRLVPLLYTSALRYAWPSAGYHHILVHSAGLLTLFQSFQPWILDESLGFTSILNGATARSHSSLGESPTCHSLFFEPGMQTSLATYFTTPSQPGNLYPDFVYSEPSQIIQCEVEYGPPSNLPWPDACSQSSGTTALGEPLLEQPSCVMVASTLVHDYSASELKKCPLQPCDFTFIYRNTEYFLHLRKAHANVYTCNFCQKHFSSQYRLSYHVERSGHAAIHCHHDGCGRVFSRADTYQRHLRTHQKDAQRFPCTYCKKYRGENGFKRKDHLRQHVRNYHHIEDVESGTQLLLNSSRKYACPCMACPQYRQNPFRGPFKKFSEYMAHMKSVHNESDYPCPEPNCERVDGKGYFRKADLRTHLRKIHGTDGALAGDQV